MDSISLTPRTRPGTEKSMTEKSMNSVCKLHTVIYADTLALLTPIKAGHCILLFMQFEVSQYGILGAQGPQTGSKSQ